MMTEDNTHSPEQHPAAAAASKQQPHPQQPGHPAYMESIDAEAAALAKAIAEAEAKTEGGLAAMESARDIMEAEAEADAMEESDSDSGSSKESVTVAEITISETKTEVDGSLVYDMQTTAEMAGIHPDLLALYVKLGFVETTVDSVESADGQGDRFDDEALYVLRRIADLRYEHGVNLKGIGLVLSLLRQVQRLEAELRFLRGK